MSKSPKSKVAIALFVFASFFAIGCLIALYQFVQLAGDTRPATIAKISVLEAIRYSGIAALITFVTGYIVQMIADIRWKLFEGQVNA